jgi:probable HAF family extracellular repeat protein
MDGDTPPRRVSTSGRSRQRVRRNAIKRATAALVVASAVVAVAAAPAASAGARSDRGRHSRPPQPPSYVFVDPGTFGGPLNFLNYPGIPVTDNGVLVGAADTTIVDTDYPEFSSDPFLAQAFAWRDGRLINLGALPGNNSSGVFAMNNRGVGAGYSENGRVDPSTGGPAVNAVLFKHRRVVNLGTLAGGYESTAFTINDRGDVAGVASNGIADPFSMFGWPTQTRAFSWRHGVMRDIGTLGGPDSVPEWLNARGQVVGESYTNSTPNAATGIPTLHPFLWTRGRMQDLGTLGGTRATAARVNDRGQAVGNSNLAGDRVRHPYLWDRNRGLQDLGTLGGDSGYANWVDDRGDVVGAANLPGSQVSHGFLWTHGKMRDLPPAGTAPCSDATAINDSGVLVGGTNDCHDNAVAAMVWRHGHATDLNTLIAPTSTHLTKALYLSERGEIVGESVLANGGHHMFLLIPRTR